MPDLNENTYQGRGKDRSTRGDTTRSRGQNKQVILPIHGIESIKSNLGNTYDRRFLSQIHRHQASQEVKQKQWNVLRRVTRERMRIKLVYTSEVLNCLYNFFIFPCLSINSNFINLITPSNGKLHKLNKEELYLCHASSENAIPLFDIQYIHSKTKNALIYLARYQQMVIP